MCTTIYHSGCDLRLNVIPPTNSPMLYRSLTFYLQSTPNRFYFWLKYPNPMDCRISNSSVWGQISRSWIEGDNTCCSPLIGPPLGVCVCVNVCFQALICIHSPCTESYKSPHSQRGIEGERRGGGQSTGKRKVRAKSFHLSEVSPPLTSKDTVDFLSLEQNLFCFESIDSVTPSQHHFLVPFEIRKWSSRAKQSAVAYFSS